MNAKVIFCLLLAVVLIQFAVDFRSLALEWKRQIKARREKR
jgi:hypothetical protein